MSIKFIKIRFNTNASLDKKALDVLKGVDGQNAFIKNAILSYAGKGREDVIAEKIVSLLNEKLQSVPIITNPTGMQDTDTDNNADMDIADAFLDSL